MLLLAERSMASAELLTGLSEVALPSLRTIAQSTASELADAKQWHIPGYRCQAPTFPRRKAVFWRPCFLKAGSPAFPEPDCVSPCSLQGTAAVAHCHTVLSEPNTQTFDNHSSMDGSAESSV